MMGTLVVKGLKCEKVCKYSSHGCLEIFISFLTFLKIHRSGNKGFSMECFAADFCNFVAQMSKCQNLPFGQPWEYLLINFKHVRNSLCRKCPYQELFWSVFSRIRTEYSRIQSKCGKIRTRITPSTDTFCAVIFLKFSNFLTVQFINRLATRGAIGLFTFW